MLRDETERPNYREGQYLRAADFVAEQRYHSDLRRRLALGQHTWGIFAGLELEERPLEGSGDRVDVFVAPGLAIDGFGRELIAYAPQKLDAAQLLNPTQPEGWVPVWIRYAAELAEPPPYGYEICDDPDFAQRTRETFRIEVGERPTWHRAVTVAGRATADEELPVDLSVPHQGLPDDAEDGYWLVPLGHVRWDGAGDFLPSRGEEDRGQRLEGRVYGGAVAAHTYPPAAEWELASRGRPGPEDPTRVAAAIRGALRVEDVVVATGDGVELHGSPLSFLDAKGGDRGRPFGLARVDAPGGADLRLQLGRDGSGENRLIVDSDEEERVVVRDDGSADLKGDLHVAGVLDLVEDEGDRVALWGAAGEERAAAIGVERGGAVLYSRAERALRWYVDAEPDDGGSARMALGPSRLSIRGDALVGWGANGRLKTRHVDGKSGSDDGDGGLYLNWNNGQRVTVGSSGTPADLVVHGDLLLGDAKVAPVDVVVGTKRFDPPLSGSGGSNSGFFWVPVTSRIPQVSDAQFVVGLSDIQNNHTAVGARWQVEWTGTAWELGANRRSFLVQWRIDDSDGHIYEVAWTAVFVP